MKNTIVRLAEQPEKMLYGKEKASGDRMLPKDIPTLSRVYLSRIEKASKEALPVYVLSRDYDLETKTFSLFVGGEESHPELTALKLPPGTYASVTVRPLLGFLWGPAIGRAKGFFYGEWLPASDYEGRNLEYEFHTEKSMGSRPTIELYFAIKKRP